MTPAGGSGRDLPGEVDQGVSRAEPRADEPHAPHDAASLLAEDHEDGPRAGVLTRRAGGVLPLLFGLVTAFAAVRLGVGQPSDPGAGMWPLIVSLAIIVCALILLATERDERDYEKYTRGAFKNLLGVLSLLLFVVLLQNAGLEIATLVVSAFWLKYLGEESWRTTAAMSVGITVVAYLLFITGLGAPIPRLLSI